MKLKKLLLLLTLQCICAVVYADNVRFKEVIVESQPRENREHTRWREFATRVIDTVMLDKPVEQTTYGSLASSKLNATGFFRTEKIDGRWWVVDPDGYLHLQRAVAGVRLGRSENNEAAMAKKYKTEKNWIKQTIKTLQDAGFYGSGSWSSDDLIEEYNEKADEPFGNSRIFNFMASYGKKRGGTYQRPGNTGYPNQAIFVFDPEFETFCDAYAKANMPKYKEDKALLGYFSDNEMPLSKANLEGYLTLENPKDHGRKAAEAYIKSKGISDVSQVTDQMREEFVGIVADRYYSIVSAAIKKYDPNHLYLGTRLHGGAKYTESVVRAAAKYCDIISVNYYGRWAPTDREIADWAEWGDKPYMITEFYTKGMDSGMGNTSGAGFRVRTQADRGLFYQNFCLKLLESKIFIGWQHFRYQDNDPEAKGVDPSNIDSNKGVVNTYYEYYDDFMYYAKQLNQNVYSIIDHFDNN